MNKKDGMNFLPTITKNIQVVQKGEFVFAAAALDHGHIYAMTQALTDAGGVCRYVYDPVPERVAAFVKHFPDTRAARSPEEILQDKDVRMVAAAGIPNTRGALGIKVMTHGKDYFVDKCPFTTLQQLEQAREACRATGRKYMVYYGERLHSEASEYAMQLVLAGAIGRVIQVIGLGPHRLNKPARPPWFFDKEQYGGILCDIGCHQVEQFLAYAQAKDAKVLHSKVGNFNNPEHPQLEDFGDASLLADNGASNYFRVDWFTPQASPVWGDGRLTLLGTQGTIEVRKYYNPHISDGGGHVYLCNQHENTYFNASGQVGCPFFGALILDSLNRTEKAMTQQHAFLAAQLALEAQAKAVCVA